MKHSIRYSRSPVRWKVRKWRLLVQQSVTPSGHDASHGDKCRGAGRHTMRPEQRSTTIKPLGAGYEAAPHSQDSHHNRCGRRRRGGHCICPRVPVLRDPLLRTLSKGRRITGSCPVVLTQSGRHDLIPGSGSAGQGLFPRARATTPWNQELRGFGGPGSTAGSCVSRSESAGKAPTGEQDGKSRSSVAREPHRNEQLSGAQVQEQAPNLDCPRDIVCSWIVTSSLD